MWEGEGSTNLQRKTEALSYLPANQPPSSLEVHQRIAPRIIDRRLDSRNRTRRYRKAKRREKVGEILVRIRTNGVCRAAYRVEVATVFSVVASRARVCAYVCVTRTGRVRRFPGCGAFLVRREISRIHRILICSRNHRGSGKRAASTEVNFLQVARMPPCSLTRHFGDRMLYLGMD